MSAGVTGAGALLGGVAQYQAGQDRASLLRANSVIAGDQYASESAAGSFNEAQVERRGAALTGTQTANIGANNLQQGGTNAQVVQSSAAINQQDAQQTMLNAMRRAWGFKVQQTSDQTQVGFARAQGDFNAAGSILGGGAKAFEQEHEAGGWF